MKLQFLLRCLAIKSQGYFYLSEATSTPIILKIPTKSTRNRVDTLYFTHGKESEFLESDLKMWSVYKLKKL